MSQREVATTRLSVNEQDLTHIASALDGVRYGSVEIVIHDSRIVQIERKEKLRFDRER